MRGKRLGFALEETRQLFALYDAHKGGNAHIPRFMALIARRRALLVQQLRTSIACSPRSTSAWPRQCVAALKARGKRLNRGK
ncbi:MAG: MerR family DNA-binding protein [Pseudomonadota bacterium]